MKGENWSVSTYNKRLNILCHFFTWLQNSGVITSNSLSDVNRKRSKKKKKSERRIPLTEEEISVFLEAIRLDTFCHKCSPVKHSFYHPFLKFIFLTGVRNAEAIGLRIRHIDFESGLIEISEALARTVKGTNHAARIQKGTKTDNVRYLPIAVELKELLIVQIQGKNSDDFVFASPKWLSIDDRMLERRVIKPVLIWYW
jgi:integrase